MGRGRIGGIGRTLLEACLCFVALVGAAGCGSQGGHHIVLPPGTTFSVMLTTDRPTYGVSQPIGVTVQNTSGTAYYAQDGRSACTIVALQELVRQTWRDEMPCVSGQSPTILLVAPHSSVPFTLAPGNALDDPNSWAAGIYRVALIVNTKPDNTGSAIQVYSAAFQVSAT